MVTVRMTVNVPNDRQLLITLPPEVAIGHSELEIRISAPLIDGSERPGVPAASILGIARGDGVPPDDGIIAEWIHEHYLEKYG